MSTPFVGRHDELQLLGTLVSQASRENLPTAAVISGEPGSGKSRLLREAVAGIDGRRCVSLVGFEPTQPVPLAAAGDLIRRLATVPEHGPRLEALVFGSADLRGQGALPAFEAAHRAVGAFGPLVVAVDDLQWLDEQTLAMLHYLIRAAESTRQQLVVMVAARPSSTEVSFDAAIAAALPEARRARLQLSGLSREAGVALARAIDSRLDERTAEELWKRAGGSPFWVEALSRNRGSTDGAPLVSDRLRAISLDGAELINALAVGGRPFGRDQLGEVLGWPEVRLDHAVREVTARGLTLEEYGSVRLSHDLIREAAAATIPTPARRRLHRRFAELLEGWAGPDLHLLSETLDHREASGLRTDDLAARILASPQRRLIGVDGLRRLAAIADSLHSGSVEQRSLDVEIGRLAGVLGDAGLALRHWLRLAEHAVTPADRQRAAGEAALAAYRLGRATEAHAHLDRARSVAPPTPETLAWTEALHAEVALWLDHDTRVGAAAAGRALDGAREMVTKAGGLDRLPAASRRTYVGALEASMGAAMQEERFDDIRRLSREILPAARALDEESHVAALLRSGFALRPLGAIETAEARYREAWDISHASVLPYPMIDAGIGLARALRDLGRLREARDIALETVQLEARLGSPPGRWGNAVATLHATELSIGEPHGLDRVRDDARMHPNPHFRMWIHQLLAVWQARLGGAHSQREVELSIAAGEADSALAGCPRCGGELAAASVEALARVGRIDEARRRLEAWEARGVAEYPWQTFLRLRARASIAMAEDDRAAALELLAGLRGVVEDGSQHDDLVWVILDVGAVQESLDRTAAVAAYTEAAALAQEIGASGRARLAAKALRRLGVRAWRRGPRAAANDVLAELSQREREVAGLVAGGATNLEVATLLAISPKTVERHVTNILAKLGARNRTELAARLPGSGTGFPR